MMKLHMRSSTILLWFIAVAFALAGCSSRAAPAQQPSDLILWFDEAAERWEEALPVGNGRLGAMVFGGLSREQIQLNEETVWAGEPGNNLQNNLRPHLPEIRRLLFAGKNEEAQELAYEHLPRHAAEGNNYGMPYQTVGDLYLDFPGHQDATSYYRDLDIGSAVSTVSYEAGGVSYEREVFASLTDDVIEELTSRWLSGMGRRFK